MLFPGLHARHLGRIWRMNLLAGSAANDPYSRLRIAITSILALNKSETIYFEALADNDGAPLGGLRLHR